MKLRNRRKLVLKKAVVRKDGEVVKEFVVAVRRRLPKNFRRHANGWRRTKKETQILRRGRQKTEEVVVEVPADNFEMKVVED